MTTEHFHEPQFDEALAAFKCIDKLVEWLGRSELEGANFQVEDGELVKERD